MQDNTWNLPNPEPIDDRIEADGSSLREYLEDVEMELLLRMHKLVSDYGMINPHASEVLSSADRDIERTLGAQGCTFDHTSLPVCLIVDDETDSARADTRYVTLRRTMSSNEAIP
jgi:hypothetical protein